MAVWSGFLALYLMLIVALHQAVSSGKWMKKSNRCKCDVLVNQLVSLKGITRCNLVLDYTNRSPTIDELQAKLSKFMPVLSIKNPRRRDWKKYDKRSYTNIAKYHNKPRKQPGLFNYATSNALFIFVANLQGKFKQNFRTAYRLLAGSSSVPKVLLVFLESKAQLTYKGIFRLLLGSNNVVDVDILQISKSPRESKRDNGLKQTGDNFVVYQYNPFTRAYKKQKLTERVEWFQPKTMDLHGFQLNVNKLTKSMNRTVNGKNFSFPADIFWNEKSKSSTAFKSLMNFTYNYQKVRLDLIFTEHQCASYSEGLTLKPHLIETVHIYIPVIYDSKLEVDLADFFLFFPLILMIAFVLNLLSKFGQFDPRTWSLLATSKMLLGLDNPTGITGSVLESLLFILISFTGVFFSNEFSNAVTGILNPITEERHFHTVKEVIASNISFQMWARPLFISVEGCHLTHSIAWLKGRILMNEHLEHDPSGRILCNTISKALNSSRIAFSYPEGPLASRVFGQKIQVEGNIRIRRSGLCERKLVESLQIKAYSPLNERLSDIYWRFYESGFHNFMNTTNYVEEVHKQISHLYYLGNQEMNEDDEEEADFLLVYCGTLLFGSILAILALIAEILIAPPSSTNQSGSRVDIEVKFICFEAEFYEYQEPTQEENEEEPVRPIDDSSQTPQDETTEEIVLLETSQTSIQVVQSLEQED